MLDTTNLFLGDANIILQQLADSGVKVDAIITDPPYNISRDNNYATIRTKEGGIKYSKGIDFAEWDKDFDIIGWLEPAIGVLADNASILIFNDWKNMGAIAEEGERLGLEVKDLFRWVKSNPMPRNINRRYVSDCEYVIWLTKGKWVFNRLEEPYQRPEFTSPSISRGEGLGHPTQKTEAIMEYLLKIHTDREQVVLDPFMGSGTTGAVCERLGRKFIGIEINEEYYNIAKERLDKIQDL